MFLWDKIFFIIGAIAPVVNALLNETILDFDISIHELIKVFIKGILQNLPLSFVLVENL